MSAGCTISTTTLRTAVLAVCERRGNVTPSEIMGVSVAQRIAHARHEVFATLYDIRRADGRRKYSLTTIAAPWGMDHTTVRSGILGHHARMHGAKPRRGRPAGKSSNINKAKPLSPDVQAWLNPGRAS